MKVIWVIMKPSSFSTTNKTHYHLSKHSYQLRTCFLFNATCLFLFFFLPSLWLQTQLSMSLPLSSTRFTIKSLSWVFSPKLHKKMNSFLRHISRQNSVWTLSNEKSHSKQWTFVFIVTFLVIIIVVSGGNWVKLISQHNSTSQVTLNIRHRSGRRL